MNAMTKQYRVEAWSWSRYECYVRCPFQFLQRYLVKDPARPFTQTAAMARGESVHKEIAAYIAYPPAQPAPSVPDVATKFGGLLEQLRQYDDKVVEQQWAFTRQWEPTGWFSKERGKEARLRVVLDAAALYPDMEVEALDWKTGKRYGHNDEQMELFSLGVLCHFKPAIKVTTRLVYLDSGEEEYATFMAADKEKLKVKWENKVAPMLNDTVFPPRPNDKCGWCDFSRSKGGPCRFG